MPKVPLDEQVAGAAQRLWHKIQNYGPDDRIGLANSSTGLIVIVADGSCAKEIDEWISQRFNQHDEEFGIRGHGPSTTPPPPSQN
jgi:hypothetical protein